MKKFFFGALIAFLFFQACNKDDEPIATCEDCNFTCLADNETDVITTACTPDWECTFKVVPNSVDIDRIIVVAVVILTMRDLVCVLSTPKRCSRGTTNWCIGIVAIE